MATAQYSYEQMGTDLRLLEEEYDSLIRVSESGKSLDGRTLYTVSLGNENAGKHVLVAAGIHGREHITSLILIKQLEMFCRDYEDGKLEGTSYSDLLDEVSFCLIPMANPDGITVSQRGVESIRDIELRGILYDCFLKEGLNYGNLYWKLWQANSRGVDIERNFDAAWEAYQGGPEGFSTVNYKGKQPGTEPETKLIIEMAENIGADAVVSYRAAGGNVFWGYAQDEETSGREEALAGKLAEVSGYSLQKEEKPQTCCSLYFGSQENIPAITLEMVAGRGEADFPLRDEVIPDTWESMEQVLPALAAGLAGA